jgi:hypothetical protein
LLDAVFLTAGCAAVFSLLLAAKQVETRDRLGVLSLALFLLTFDLLWTFWYHKPETIASFFCAAGSLWLAAGRARLQRGVVALLLLALAAYAATVRADTIFSFHLGILLACLLPGGTAMPLGRPMQAATSVASLGVILGTEWYIKNVLYPQAQFKAALFQLLHNLHPENLVVVVLALAPWVLTLWLAAGPGWRNLEAWQRGLVLGSLIDFCFYFIVGRSNEVRIFLPFAMTLIVLTAPLIHARLAGKAAQI